MNLKRGWARVKFDKRIFKYLLVGTLGFCVNLFLLYFITEYLNLYYLISAGIVFFMAGMVTFIFDKIWTFKEKLEKRFLNEYISFARFGLIALVLNISFLFIFTNYLRVFYVVSQAIAILITGIFGFVCNSIWTFRGKVNEIRMRKYVRKTRDRIH